MAMTGSITVSEARKTLSTLVSDTTAETLITRQGRPVGVIVGMSAWNAIDALLELIHDPQVLETLVRQRETEDRFD